MTTRYALALLGLAFVVMSCASTAPTSTRIAQKQSLLTQDDRIFQLSQLNATPMNGNTVIVSFALKASGPPPERTTVIVFFPFPYTNNVPPLEGLEIKAEDIEGQGMIVETETGNQFLVHRVWQGHLVTFKPSSEELSGGEIKFRLKKREWEASFQIGLAQEMKAEEGIFAQTLRLRSNVLIRPSERHLVDPPMLIY